MAVAALVIGGLVGFGSFLSALVFYNMNFLWALTIYSASGIATTLALITLMIIAQSFGEADPNKVKIRNQLHN